MDLSQDLRKAVTIGDVQRVSNLLLKEDVNLRSPENINLLWLAIATDQTQIIDLLIRAGADLTIEDPYELGWTILTEIIRRCEGDNQEYVQLALLAIEHGADINARDALERRSVLQFAVDAQSSILVRELIKRGAQINNEDLDHVIMQVAEFANAAETLPLLINSNLVSADTRSQRAINAINAHIASPMFNFDAFKAMLQVIVDVNQPGIDGETMLVIAVRSERFDVVSMLVDRGADINKKSTTGKLPVYTASTLSSSLMTKLLISQGGTIHDRNDDGKYPIHGACSSSSVENLLYLLSIGASVNVRDYNGKYPIHLVCSKTYANHLNLEILYLLLSFGTPLNVTDVNGNTPFSLMRYQYEPPGISHFMFIKQLAFLYTTTGAVCERDLMIIKNYPIFSKCFEKFCNELQIASQTMVFENFDLLTLLATSKTKLSAYLRNTEFAKAMENFAQRQNRCNFELKSVLRVAERIRDVVKYTENVLQQSFPVPVPHLVIEKITHYMLSGEFVGIELNCYSLSYKVNGFSIIV